MEKQITVKISRESHKKIKDSLRHGRNLFGEKLSFFGWTNKIIEAGWAVMQGIQEKQKL